jgi:hypothetical protein
MTTPTPTALVTSITASAMAAAPGFSAIRHERYLHRNRQLIVHTVFRCSFFQVPVFHIFISQTLAERRLRVKASTICNYFFNKHKKSAEK